MNPTNNVKAAICFIEEALDSHKQWVVYFQSGGQDAPGYGGVDEAREHHKECIVEYAHVLDVLRGD